jgi:dTDP-D-glucose 4,6-dehydratase
MIDLADDHYPLDVTHAKQTLEWEPRHRLRDTLPEIITRFKANPKRWYQLNGLPEAASAGKSERSEMAGKLR